MPAHTQRAADGPPVPASRVQNAPTMASGKPVGRNYAVLSGTVGRKIFSPATTKFVRGGEAATKAIGASGDGPGRTPFGPMHCADFADRAQGVY
ncbi:MAG: hypothetical protein P4N24_05370 [Acidobacteriota bacterium]|nr:hypothetical protein [Acidobacteriota bacterium]